MKSWTIMRFWNVLLFLFLFSINVYAIPPRLNIFHFDVNVGDATLILTPDKHAILIDGGNKGRGLNPIKEFLDRAKNDGNLISLDYIISTHYDSDHLGGIVDLLNNGWTPEIQLFDRGDTLLPDFDRTELSDEFSEAELDRAEQIGQWGNLPSNICGRNTSQILVKYLLAADNNGKRKTIRPGDIISLDHGVKLTALVVNAKDIDGEFIDVQFNGRKKDCAANDLSAGFLLEYGNFRYLIAGDLTGVEDEHVADVEELIKDDAPNIDVYHINHHGAEGCSSFDFLQDIKPTVVVVSNGKMFEHPRNKVIEDRVFKLSPKPEVYVTNKPSDNPEAWQAPDENIADLNYTGYDGIIELAIWSKSYRVYRWRDGNRIDSGDKFFIKER